MAISTNGGSNPTSVTYNGQNVTEVLYNGTHVWPDSVPLDGKFINFSKYYNEAASYQTPSIFHLDTAVWHNSKLYKSFPSYYSKDFVTVAGNTPYDIDLVNNSIIFTFSRWWTDSENKNWNQSNVTYNHVMCSVYENNICIHEYEMWDSKTHDFSYTLPSSFSMQVSGNVNVRSGNSYHPFNTSGPSDSGTKTYSSYYPYWVRIDIKK